MFHYGLDKDQMNRLIGLLGAVPKAIRKEVKVAINTTARSTRSLISKEVRSEVAVKLDAVKRVLKIGAPATDDILRTSVSIAKNASGEEKRIPLKEFGAKQNAKGVTYRISKSEGKKTALGAFQGPKRDQMKISWRGNVFKRVGKSRLPIVKLYGPSVWGVFVLKKKLEPTKAFATRELKKQTERRIRFITRKQAGTLRGNQR